MLKSIKDDNVTNFQKLPDNFNFKLNEIQTVKPNLKITEVISIKDYLKSLFGGVFTVLLEHYKFDDES